MQEILILLVSFSAIILAGYFGSKLFATIKRSLKDDDRQPVENAKVRMKTASSLYRCRLISQGPEGWVFSAPIQRDYFVPIPFGEEVTCEVLAKGGVLIFKTRVIGRRSEEKSIVVENPKNVAFENRREDDRRDDISMDVTVAGKSGSVMDLSPGGARVKIRGFEREGNVVQIDLPSGESRAATIVDSKNDHIGSVIRLKFDEPIQLPSE